jgi:uncharacterized protein
VTAGGPFTGVADGMRVERTWIPMPDGIRLAATLYRPAGASPGDRFPPLLEYLPYRKDDAMAERDHDLYAYMVARGYVGARVDIRGTGASEGMVPDGEYSEQEHADAEAAIAWLATQPWSSGSVGMWGISWGGFNAIQMAMREPPPPALKAICAAMATDDLFQDDIHFIDGQFHVDEYELMIDLLTAMSPPPGFPVDEATLGARFDRPPWKLRWLRAQRDGPTWRRGSLAPDYERLRVPAMLIGGWLDGYRDSVPRMVERVPAPVKAILGPWNHTFPHDASPGPRIEWRAQAVRWFDRWLKGRDTVVERDPPLAVYVREWHPPGPVDHVPGSWRWLDGWPPSELEERRLYPAPDGSLGPMPEAAEAIHRTTTPPATGVEAGFWWGELVPDQRPIDDRSLRYDTVPLEEDLVIVGMPRAVLRAATEVPLAHWFVRLCDVAPDGTSVLVAGAGLNGAHRRSALRPEPLEPGREERLEIELHATSWTFPAGHRIRLAVTNAMWPMIWPSPFLAETSLRVGGEDGTHLVLPVLPDADALPSPSWDPPTPKIAAPGIRSGGDPFPAPWTVRRDERWGTTTVSWRGTQRLDLGWCVQTYAESMSYRVSDEQPDRASVSGEATTTVEMTGRVLVWRGLLEIESDAESFLYFFGRWLQENGRLIRSRRWDERVPRDFQ